MADKPSETHLIRSLEPRLMYDAAAVETHADVAAQQIAQQQPDPVPPPAQSPADAAHPVATDHTGTQNNADNHLPDTSTAANTLNAPLNSASGLSVIASALAEHNVSQQTGAEYVFVDTSVPDYQALLTGINPTAQVVLLNNRQDGLTQIQTALAGQQNVAAIYLISHGSAGEIELGSALLNSQTINNQYAAGLHSIGQSLAKNVGILIYGCDFAAGPTGRQAMNELAALTGANVAASNNNTGAAALGGDWNLEVQTGPIDAVSVLNPQALADYPNLLDLPVPQVNLSDASFLGLTGTFTFTATFSNTAATGTGYGPYLELLLPTTGADGKDTASFVSATSQGQALTAYTLSFNTEGQAINPIALDGAGNPLVISAADYGLQAGDTLVILPLPFHTISAGQPPIPIEITATFNNLSSAAANAQQNLNISALAGFQSSTDTANNPIGPAIQDQNGSAISVHSPVLLTQSLSGNTQALATGPSNIGQLTNTVQIAQGLTISNFDLSQNLPDNIIVTAITPGNGGVITSITLENGTLITNSAAISSTLATGTFLQAYSVKYATLSDTTATTVAFYVPKQAADGQAIIDPNTGAPVTINLAAATGSMDWSSATSHSAGNIQVYGNTAAFTAKAIALQNSLSILQNSGAAGLTPGDTLLHSIQVNISDYFAFGTGLGQNGHWLVTDILGDGQTFDSTLVPALRYTDNSGEHTLLLERGVSYFVGNSPGGNSGNKAANGQTYLSFDLAAAFSQLSGGLFNAAVQTPFAAQVFISFQSRADTHYANGAFMTEGDNITDQATLQASILDSELNVTGSGDTDSSSATLTVPSTSITSAIVAYNSVLGSPATLQPGEIITIELSYTLTTGNFEHFSLQTFLPLPTLSANDPTAKGISTDWTHFSGPGLPGIGQFKLSNTDTVGVTPNVKINTTENLLTFNFGSNHVLATGPQTISVLYTIKLTDQPITENITLNILANSLQSADQASPPITLETNRTLLIALVPNSTADAKTTNNEPFINNAPPLLDKPLLNKVDMLNQDFSGITITGLPPIVEGVLNLYGSPVNVAQIIPLAQISGLNFSAPPGKTSATISYQAGTGAAHNIQSLAFNLVSAHGAGQDNSNSYQFSPSDFGFTDPNDNPADILGGMVAATAAFGAFGATTGIGAGATGGIGMAAGGSGISPPLAALIAFGGNIFRFLKPYTLPLGLIAGILFVFFFKNIVITIQSGEAGILYQRFSGTDTDTIYPEGLHLISPWNIMYIYQVRKQVALHEFDVISNKGLTIHLALAVRYLPEYELLGILHQRIGPDYLQRVILPQIESVMRKSLGNYSAEQIYTNEEGLLTKTILTALDEVGRNYVHVEDIIIRSIVLPPDIISAIEDKLKQEEFLKSYEFRIQTASQEGERLKIEADAIRDYNKLVNDTLTPTNLMHKGIMATQKLADSPNPKVVIIGSGKNGMPLILGGDQNPPPPAAAEPTGKAEKADLGHE